MRARAVLGVLAVVGAVGSGYWVVEQRGWRWEAAVSVGRAPRVRPDYGGVVLPPNIAPLSFTVVEAGDRHHVRLQGAGGSGVDVQGRGMGVRMPVRAWQALLKESRGAEIQMEVYARGPGGRWERYEPIRMRVAREETDPYIVYRLINPMYNFYAHMSICQRNVQSYEETVIWDNSAFKGCMNCHSFLANRPEAMIIQMRSGEGPCGAGMLLLEHGRVSKVDTRTRYSIGPAGFTSWHPSGRALAFSMNKVRQFFHTARAEARDGIDMVSDMAVYLLDSHSVTSTPAISRPDRLETWPAWSADGRYLYFCSAPMLWSDTGKVPPERYAEVRYDLMRISYDLDSGRWGALETVLSSKETGLSITQPRPSPDGRFLVFCMSDYSVFPTFQPSSDLYLMDLGTGRYERMACNSERAESWHSWSSNGRWLVFSTKRPDGLFLKPYFTYVDESGTAHKPFALPQRDPAFYDRCFKLFQMPELVRGPVTVGGEQILDALASGSWTKADLAVTGATPARSSGGP